MHGIEKYAKIYMIHLSRMILALATQNHSNYMWRPPKQIIF